MNELGPTVPFHIILLFWIARIVFLAFVCTFLAFLGVRILDALTPHIHEREKLGKEPFSTGLFVAGFLIFIGLVIHGAATSPTAIGVSALESIIDPLRLGFIAVSFFITLLVGIALFNIFDRLTPKISFRLVNESSSAVGIYVFGYLIFLGLIVHAALTIPL